MKPHSKMIAQSVFFLISFLTISEQCLKTIPPEEVYVTATTIIEFESTTVNLCNDCDIDEVLQDQGGNKIVPNEILEKEPIDGCYHYYVACFNDDYVTCNSITVYAESGDETVVIGTPSPLYGDVHLQCGRDGTFFWNSVKNIKMIYCIFDGCL